MRDKELRQALSDCGILYWVSLEQKPGFKQLFVPQKEPVVLINTGGKCLPTLSRLDGNVRKEVPITKAVEMIIQHLGLELDYTPEAKEKINGLRKIKRPKKG